MDKFSQDLAAELKSKGIVVQTLHPGLVATKLALNVNDVKPSISSPDPLTFARGALKTIGVESRTAGYWNHKIQVSFSKNSDPIINSSFIFIFTVVLL